MKRLLFIAFFLFISPSMAAASALSVAAASMAPGTWLQFSTSNINALQQPGTDGNMLSWDAKSAWAPVERQLLHVSNDHIDGVLTQALRFAIYREDTNTWESVASGNSAFPPFSQPGVTNHGYRQHAIDPYRGILYRRTGKSSSSWSEYHVATRTWNIYGAGVADSGLQGGTACCSGAEFIPELQGIVHIQGGIAAGGGEPTGARIRLFNRNSRTWSKLANTVTALVNGTDTFIAYSPKKKTLIFGQTTIGFFKLVVNANGTVTGPTQLTNPPITLYDGTGFMMTAAPDPVTGDFIVLSASSRTQYTYDPTTDVWTQITPGTKPTLTNRIVVATPISNYGVIWHTVCQGSTCTVWLYKHANYATGSYEERCASPTVLKCFGFENPSEIAGTVNTIGTPPPITQSQGFLPGQATVTLDPTIKASGDASAKYDIAPGQNGNANFFVNFSNDYLTQFGANSTFYVQFRQRFSTAFIAQGPTAGGEFKQIHIGTGHTATVSQGSCSDLEIVTQHTGARGFPQMYSGCPGADPLGSPVYNQSIGGGDFLLQNARANPPGCRYLQGPPNGPAFPGTYFTTGNCVPYVANEWMTFTYRVDVGPRSGSYFTGSRVRAWAARDGLASVLFMDWTYGSSDPKQQYAGSAAANQRFGMVWLDPRNADLWSAQVQTWYDDVIISTSAIADPGTGPSTDLIPPSAPTNLIVLTVTNTQINVSWIISTDNVGVDHYGVERCAGAACINFIEVAAPTTNSFSDTGLTPGTLYRYRVRAFDAALNFSTYSSVEETSTNLVGGSVFGGQSLIGGHNLIQ